MHPRNLSSLLVVALYVCAYERGRRWGVRQHMSKWKEEADNISIFTFGLRVVFPTAF